MDIIKGGDNNNGGGSRRNEDCLLSTGRLPLLVLDIESEGLSGDRFSMHLLQVS
jgi:hypothetical protein